MITIKYMNDEAVLSFPKKLISNDYVQSFIERLNVEAIIQKGRFKEKDLMELSEKIKKDWWQRNKNRFIKKIKE